MIKLDVDDLVYEVVAELVCYEDISEDDAKKWEAGFRAWLNNKNIKKENVVKEGSTYFYCVEDEMAVFDIAEEYLDAVEGNRVSEYWKNFQ